MTPAIVVGVGLTVCLTSRALGGALYRSCGAPYGFASLGAFQLGVLLLGICWMACGGIASHRDAPVPLDALAFLTFSVLALMGSRQAARHQAALLGDRRVDRYDGFSLALSAMSLGAALLLTAVRLLGVLRD